MHKSRELIKSISELPICDQEIDFAKLKKEGILKANICKLKHGIKELHVGKK